MRTRKPSPPGLLNSHEIAAALGISYDTYRKWRMAGKGPHTFSDGKYVWARESAVEEWWAERERAAAEPKNEMRPPEARLSRRPRAQAA